MSEVLKGKSAPVILGYGFLRNREENPWFKYRELEEAIPEGPTKRFVVPTKSHYSTLVRDYEEQGLLNGRQNEAGDRGKPSPRNFVKVTEEGEEALLETLTFHVTHKGLTLPGLLHIPEVIEIVQKESDLYDRVIKAISGAAIRSA